MGKAYDGAMALYGLGKKLSAPAVGAGLATQSEDADAGIVNVIDEATGAAKRVIEAWHGSPHKFDKFSMDNIGTGEGAQAYGHGLYFADEKDVSKQYIPRDLDHEDWMYQQYKLHENDPYMADAWERAMQHDYPSDLRDLANDPDYDEYTQEAYRAVADALEANPPEGMLAKVHLDVDPDTLLDWDKPLSEQSEAVRNAIVQTSPKLQEEAALGLDPFNPHTINAPYRSGHAWLTEAMEGSPQAKSAALREAGIPGIRYLDGMSRDGGSGTYNYVMFDDAPISIMERGNAAPELLGYMGAVGGSLAAYGKLREEKEGRWSGLKQDALSLASGVGEGIGFALEALEMPTRGLHGVASAAGVLFFGGSVEDAVRRGATVAQQPLDTTAQQVGQYVADETGNPYLAAGADAITRVMALEP